MIVRAVGVGIAVAVAAALGPLLVRLAAVVATPEPIVAGLRASGRPSRRMTYGWTAVAVVAAAAIAVWSPSLPRVALLAWFAAVLVVVSAVDVVHYRIPDRVTFPSVGVGVVLVAVLAALEGGTGPLVGAGLGALTFSGVLGLAHLVSPRGMGLGDVKLAVVLGLVCGAFAPGVRAAFTMVLAALFAASIAGTLLGVALLVVRRRNAPFPFGPALAAGSFVVALWAAAG